MHGVPVLAVALAASLLAASGAEAMPTDKAQPPSARAAAGVKLVQVGTFSGPLLATAPRGDRRRLFVVQQAGQVMLVRNGKQQARPFLDISGRVLAGGEQGLLGLAFAPDYAQSKRFYVYYTGKSGNQNVVEFRAATPDRANPASARRVLRMADPESNHNGGNLAFGPDGLLYIGTGDGGGGNDQHGSRGNAQDLGSLLGKLLRIDPRRHGRRAYAIPRSNPFVGRSGARGEIYSYGLRNPWRFSFDRKTGALTIGDVGQNAVEEIDFARKGRARGANYGWRPLEGNRRNFNEPAPGAVAPVITHDHGSGFCSITGGFIARDRAVPALYGRYLYSDFCDGHVWVARLRSGGASGVRRLGVRAVGGVSSFGEDGRGRLYVVSLNGPVYRFAAR